MKKSSRSQNRRNQTPKPRNEALARAMQEKRRSNATQPIPSGKRYSRKSKHQEW